MPPVLLKVNGVCGETQSYIILRREDYEIFSDDEEDGIQKKKQAPPQRRGAPPGGDAEKRSAVPPRGKIPQVLLPINGFRGESQSYVNLRREDYEIFSDDDDQKKVDDEEDGNGANGEAGISGAVTPGFRLQSEPPQLLIDHFDPNGLEDFDVTGTRSNNESDDTRTPSPGSKGKSVSASDAATFRRNHTSRRPQVCIYSCQYGERH